MKKHCNHCAKYQAIQVPRSNCANCWDKYFITHKNYVAFDVNAIEKLGRDNLVKLRGEKYVKNLERFSDANHILELYRQGQLEGWN